jgi:hypothetical protein
MSLAHRQEQLVSAIKEGISVIAAKHPIGELGDAYEELEEAFEALACCHLLLHADVTRFRHNLVWSVFARRDYLTRSAAEALDDFHLARSRSQAVFCALAAGDPALAVAVGDLSPGLPMRDGEYPDDFAYHWLIHLLQKSSDDVSLDAASLALERADGQTERLEVCKALITRDAAAFESSFEELIVVHEGLMAEELPLHEDRPTFEPRSQLFVEGLALLRLAEQRGIIPAADDYRLCPSLARLRTPSPPPEDIFALL